MSILRFSWPGEKPVARRTLSPIAHDFTGIAPLYLQAGGHEILHDMIVDFARKQAALGADIMLDTWPTMPHDFHLFDNVQSASREARARIAQAVRCRVDLGQSLAGGPNTIVATSGNP